MKRIIKIERTKNVAAEIPGPINKLVLPGAILNLTGLNGRTGWRREYGR